MQDAKPEQQPQPQPAYLRVVNPRVGDQVIYRGHLYWIALVIDMADKTITFALRQAHWPDRHVILVPKVEVCPDVPFTA
jgi:hypothetical protein